MGCAASSEVEATPANPRSYGGTTAAKPAPAAAAKPTSVASAKKKPASGGDSSSSSEKEETADEADARRKSEKSERSAGGRPSMPPKRPSLLALETTGYNHRDSFYGRSHLVDSEQGKRFKEVYKLGEKLGSGAFSTVREGTRLDYDATMWEPDDPEHPPAYAIKIVRKENLTPLDEGALMDEIEILKEVGMYKHIIRLYDIFEEKKFYYMVTEKMSGGELYDRIVMKEHYNENEARNVSETLVAALGYCHVRRIAHRDLKPANLLMCDPSDDATIKIADFGFAKRVRKPKSLSTKCGTPQYVAPEVLSGKLYDTQADMWSIGIIIFTLLVGHPPFENDNLRELVKMIKKGNVVFTEKLWGKHSEESKKFLRCLLEVDPDKRYDARAALMSDWIDSDDETLAEISLDDNLQRLKVFNAKRKFKAAVKAIVAAKKMQLLIDMKNGGVELDPTDKRKLKENDCGSSKSLKVTENRNASVKSTGTVQEVEDDEDL